MRFTPTQHRYETAKTTGVSVVTVIAPSDDSDATIEVLTVRSDDSPLVIDTSDADPNTAGHQILLSEAGGTLVLVLVTSADAKRQDIYLVLVRQPTTQPQATPKTPGTKNTLARGLQRDTAVPTLTALNLDGITLTPQFAATTTDYTATVDADIAQVTVTASPAGDASVMLTPADADTNTAGWQIALPAADPGGAAVVILGSPVSRSTVIDAASGWEHGAVKGASDDRIPRSPWSVAAGAGRRRLSPVQKYARRSCGARTGERTVAECADHWGVERSTIQAPGPRGLAKRGALDELASRRPGRWCAEGVDPSW